MSAEGMTSDQVRSWISDNLERKQAEFGLGDWQIILGFMRLDDDGNSCRTMLCRRYPESRRAMISVDADRCAELYTAAKLEEDFDGLMHVLDSPSHLVHRTPG